MKKIVLISIMLLAAGCSSATMQKASVSLAYSNFDDGDYQDTLYYISQAENEQKPTPELKAELAYLKAQTYEKMGEKRKAIGLYEYLRDRHSKSQYGYLARKRLKSLR